ncbi:MAG: hypothetical protein AABY15_02975 [Nanoarchaeota archaeon]
MRTTLITAKFKGQDGSLGYETGKPYTLKLSHSGGYNIQIERATGGGDCEYQSMISFLNNWDEIHAYQKPISPVGRGKMEERYAILCDEVKHQIHFMTEPDSFDFEYLQQTINEMKSLKEKLEK